MNGLSDFNSIFAPNVQIPDENKADLIEWRPSYKNAPNNTYQAIIRFIPNPQDPTNSILEKYTCYLKDPSNPMAGRYVDSPASVGERCPIGEAYWTLKNSPNVVMQDKAKELSRTLKYSMLVQIIQDQVDPKNNGKILVWRVGKKVYDKIANELKPLMEGIPPRNPFDIINGRAFFVKIVEVSKFNNYDQCQFIDLPVEQSCMKLTEKNEDGTLRMVENVTAASDKQKVYNFLLNNAPDLNKFKYQPWDEETTRYVDNVIASLTGKNMQGQPVQFSTPQQKVASLESIIGGTSTITEVRGETSSPQPPVNVNDLTSQASPQVSISGLNLDGQIPQQPSGNVSGVDLSDISSILPSGNVASPSVTTQAPNLDDILASTFGG